MKKKVAKTIGMIFGGFLGLMFLMILAIAIFEPTPTEKKDQSETTGSAITAQAVKKESTKDPKETKKAKETKPPKAIKTEEATAEPTQTPIVEKKYKKPSVNDLYGCESGDMYVTMSFMEIGELIQVSFTVDVLGEVIDSAEYYSSLKKSEEENIWVSDDGRMTFLVADDGSITVKDSDMSIEYNLTGTYTVAGFYEEEIITEEIEFINASKFRDFIGDTSNIGKTVKFKATVYSVDDEYYWLIVSNNGKVYEVFASPIASAPILVPTDEVLITGVYDGYIARYMDGEFCFTTVSIELQ